MSRPLSVTRLATVKHLAGLLNLIAVAMFVVLGAVGDHSPSVEVWADSHETVVAEADVVEGAFVDERGAEESESAIHCGAPILGCEPAAGPARSSCENRPRPFEFATLGGVVRAPEPDPPRAFV